MYRNLTLLGRLNSCRFSFRPCRPDIRKANQEKIEAEEKAENDRIEQYARDKREREAETSESIACSGGFCCTKPYLAQGEARKGAARTRKGQATTVHGVASDFLALDKRMTSP